MLDKTVSNLDNPMSILLDIKMYQLFQKKKKTFH